MITSSHFNRLYRSLRQSFGNISLTILGLVDNSVKLYDTPYTRMYANENCVTQLQNDSVVEQWLCETKHGGAETDTIAVQYGVMNA